jgi:hypothetical protein
MSTNGRFKPCYKKSDVILLLVHKPSLYLIYLLTNNNLLCCSFCTNICVYNCTLAFTSVSYKKDTQINFSNNI